MNKKILLLCYALMFVFYCNASSVYQWSVQLEGKDKDARAFLWVPPNCKQVRGIVLANQVILEDLVCANEYIRNACEKESIGIVLIFRSPFTQFSYREGESSFNPLQKILDDLSAISGYSEISKAPLFTIGHSGGANGAWNIAYCKPQRVFGMLTLHAAATVNPPEYDSKSRVEGIPVMAVSGEYESWTGKDIPLDKHWHWLRGDLLDLRAKYEHSLVCEVVQPGAGHFNFDNHLAQLCAMFLQKAAHQRIPLLTPIGDSVVLNKLDESKGWLTDIRILSNDRFRPISQKAYKGDKTLAFWSLDEEMARTLDKFPSLYGGKKEQRVCFVQNQQPIPASWINELAFEPAADGITFGLKASFLRETPQGVADAGTPLLHSSIGKIKFSLIGGWGGGGEQVAADSFRIQFGHLGTSRHSANIQIMAYHQGDSEYKYAEQAGQVKFPDKNKEGQPQTISFFDIQPIKQTTKKVQLQATSSAGLPVYYYVKEGPAIIKGSTLMIDQIPPRSKLPIKITVVAWQWGRSKPPLIQTAIPIEKDIWIVKE